MEQNDFSIPGKIIHITMVNYENNIVTKIEDIETQINTFYNYV